MRITLAQPTKTILQEIARPEMRRKDVAMTYAMCLALTDKRVDWPRINKAIMGRWSLSGLSWIKARAWKLVEEKHTQDDSMWGHKYA